MSVIVMSRWVPVSAGQQPPIGERVIVSDGITGYEGQLGPDGQWYRSAAGRPVLLENFLFGDPGSWYWMKLPAPPGRA